MPPLTRLALLLSALLALVAWFFTHLEPAAQVRKHTQRLLEATGARDWKRVEKLLSASYQDSWHTNREQALESAQLLGQHFLTLHIRPRQPPQIKVSSSTAQWSAGLEFLGRGHALGEAILNEANALTGPFLFEWQRPGWQPWHWQLVRVSQAELSSSSGK